MCNRFQIGPRGAGNDELHQSWVRKSFTASASASAVDIRFAFCQGRAQSLESGTPQLLGVLEQAKRLASLLSGKRMRSLVW